MAELKFSGPLKLLLRNLALATQLDSSDMMPGTEQSFHFAGALEQKYPVKQSCCKTSDTPVMAIVASEKSHSSSLLLSGSWTQVGFLPSGHFL